MSRQREIPVIFRKWPESEGGGVIALFPTALGTSDYYTCDSYETIGQHGSADPVGVIERTKPAKPSEYADLLAELKSIGYRNLKIYQKYQRSFLDRRRAELARLHTYTEKTRVQRKRKVKPSRRQDNSPVSLRGIR